MGTVTSYLDTSIPNDAKKVFTGKIFDVYQWEQELYNGKTAIFEKLKRPNTVKVIPILPDNRILLLHEQQPDRSAFVGLPGGRVNTEEDPLLAVERELLEETGFIAEDYYLWNVTRPIKKIDWSVYTYIAKGLIFKKQPILDGGEKITLYPATFEELLDFVRTEQFEEVQLLRSFYEALLNQEKMIALQKLLSCY